MNELSDGSLPSNTELFQQVVIDRTNQQASAFWDFLRTFSAKENLIQDNFDEMVKANFHSAFWELYLPYIFHEHGIDLKRGRPSPDFHFEIKGRRFVMEAVACGEPGERNQIPKPSADFEGGIAPDDEIMQRISTAITAKAEKYTQYRKKKWISESDLYVIALNGYRAIGNYPHDKLPPFPQLPPPFIVRNLFGMKDQLLRTTAQGKSIVWQLDHQTDKRAPIGHFMKAENSCIAGVVYSSANICDYALKPELLFIQNPQAQDITEVFDFCQRIFTGVASDGKFRVVQKLRDA